MDRKFRVGVIRVLTSDDPEFVSMHGRFIEEHYPGIECVSKCIPDQWEGIHSHELERIAVPKIVETAKTFEDVDMIIVDSETNGVDDTWTAVPETYDILLINGLLDADASVAKVWGLHPSYSWWRTDFSGGHVYYLDWENELLHRITTMILDTAVCIR